MYKIYNGITLVYSCSTRKQTKRWLRSQPMKSIYRIIDHKDYEVTVVAGYDNDIRVWG